MRARSHVTAQRRKCATRCSVTKLVIAVVAHSRPRRFRDHTRRLLRRRSSTRHWLATRPHHRELYIRPRCALPSLHRVFCSFFFVGQSTACTRVSPWRRLCHVVSRRCQHWIFIYRPRPSGSAFRWENFSQCSFTTFGANTWRSSNQSRNAAVVLSVRP